MKANVVTVPERKRSRWRFLVLAGLGAAAVAIAITALWHPFGLDLSLLFRPYGLTGRIAWTSSRVIGTPDPPPHFQIVPSGWPTVPGIPVSTIRWPLDDSLVSLEESGQVYRIEKGHEATLLFDLRDRVHFVSSTHGLWDIAFSPGFAKDGLVFMSYDIGTAGEIRTAVVRYHLGGSPLKLDSPLEIASWSSNGAHKGAAMAFDGQGMLCITVGDDGSSLSFDTSYNNSQDIADLHGKMLRLDVRNARAGAPYQIPPDNPFAGMPGARAEVWALGLRNPWRMSFDAPTGSLWVDDVGEDSWEAVYRMERGANYGWSLREGGHEFRTQGKQGPGDLKPPFASHSHSECRAIAGGLVYRGKKFPELNENYLYGDYVTGRIYRRPISGGSGTPELVADTRRHIMDLIETADESILVTTDDGQIHLLHPTEQQSANADFPKLLSQTGLFRSTKDHEVSDGIISYEVNSPLWSDGALKKRFVAIPNLGTATGGGSFVFPNGTVFVKTFSLRLDESDPRSERRVETRLMHFENGTFRGYSYRWNASQDDATLVGADGESLEYEIKSPAGMPRAQTWRIPSRAQCFACHTASAGFILGFTVPQLNRDKDYGERRDNQLRALGHIGLAQGFWGRRYLNGRMPAAAKLVLPHYADPSDTQEPLEKRARSYLNTNCGNCHRYIGGGNSAFYLDYESILRPDMPLAKPPIHGLLGVENALVLSPGDPEHSMLYRRMTMNAIGRMPKLGVSVIDTQGAALVHDWIKSLKTSPGAQP